MALNDAIMTSVSYLLFTSSIIYAQMVSQDLAEPEIDLKVVGLAMYGIGIAVNFYHHILLSRLRREGDREYKIPRGGLFKVIVCLHYLFEIVEFLGIALVSQTLFAMVFVLGSTLFLIGRSYAIRFSSPC
ncbi:3-oxo-5-alpha-steroid 4-dehydrogenase 1-like [Benincasa hispida]|uniref:3-oxo-5-alpha-steroid 4-dehydrogenase 1-like n=1 Tax=Benincasa hispida TaxID=102211 RepID=UPI0019010FC8|nr:3-oxo-5-alpha-steroid 4-dehydrogenase 1-like [Benincasa hispida]